MLLPVVWAITNQPANFIQTLCRVVLQHLQAAAACLMPWPVYCNLLQDFAWDWLVSRPPQQFTNSREGCSVGMQVTEAPDLQNIELAHPAGPRSTCI